MDFGRKPANVKPGGQHRYYVVEAGTGRAGAVMAHDELEACRKMGWKPLRCYVQEADNGWPYRYEPMDE